MARSKSPSGKSPSNRSKSPKKRTDPASVPQETLDKVCAELEALLKPATLQHDEELMKEINPQMYLSVTLLLKKESLSALTTDPDVLIYAAEKSQELGVDDAKTMIRPTKTNVRNTVILREIPEDKNIKDESQVKGLFKANKAVQKEILKITKELDGQWFVTFKTESTALDAALWVRTEVGCKSSIKNESFMKGHGAPEVSPKTKPIVPGAFQAGQSQEFIPMAQQMQMAAAAASG